MTSALLLMWLAAGPDLSDAVSEFKTLPRIRSLLVSWRGTTILEQYFNGARASQPGNIKSASKSVISALVGIAIERGRIHSVKDPIGNLFPQLLNGPANAVKRGITIEDLLTMRSGLESTSNRNYGAWVLSRDWIGYALGRSLVSPPGTSMIYSTGNTHLLSAILTRTTGKSTWAFAQEALAKPLGFTLPPWPQDPQGIYFGGNDMLLTPRQMLLFGELYLRRGKIGDRQVVPAWWVDASLRPIVESPREEGRHYGYGWWIRTLAGYPTFYAWGFGGQFVFVVPDLELVVVTTSNSTVTPDRRRFGTTVYDIVERSIVTPVARAASGSSR